MTNVKAKHYDVLVAPIFTEKATIISSLNRYTFKVASWANKADVSAAVEVVFGVKPLKVNVSNTQKKKKVFKGRLGERKSYKKAIVTLTEGQTIDLGVGA